VRVVPCRACCVSCCGACALDSLGGRAHHAGAADQPSHSRHLGLESAKSRSRRQVLVPSCACARACACRVVSCCVVLLIVSCVVASC
jgi:hypothetical protein